MEAEPEECIMITSESNDTATAVLWNNLPVHLRCAESVVVFKNTIKDSSV